MTRHLPLAAATATAVVTKAPATAAVVAMKLAIAQWFACIWLKQDRRLTLCATHTPFGMASQGRLARKRRYVPPTNDDPSRWPPSRLLFESNATAASIGLVCVLELVRRLFYLLSLTLTLSVAVGWLAGAFMWRLRTESEGRTVKRTDRSIEGRPEEAIVTCIGLAIAAERNTKR